jgi:hypothetical protein
MRFSTISAAALAFAVSAFAQTAGFDVLTSPSNLESVPAGKTFTIVWTPDTTHTGTVTIHLIGGATQNTQTEIGIIARKSTWLYGRPHHGS